MSIHQGFSRQPRWLLLAEMHLSVLFLGLLDYLTTWELSVFIFYAFPIFAAAWYVDQRSALILALTGALCWWVTNAQDHPYATELAYLWAALSRFFYFIFVAIGGSALAMRTEAMKSRLEALERAAQLEQDLVGASEREQRRIGQDLHDGLCQTLVAVGFAASSLREDLEAKSSPEASAADEISRLVKNAITEARGLARGIFPVQMNVGGLAVALDELATNTARLRHIRVTLETHGDVALADPEVGMHLYRIAQEALNNAAIHSGANRIELKLNQDGDQLRLEIRDDGSGLPAKLPNGSGMGLTTMRYRAAQIGATLDLRSDSGGGTVVSCVLPARNIISSSSPYACNS